MHFLLLSFLVSTTCASLLFPNLRSFTSLVKRHEESTGIRVQAVSRRISGQSQRLQRRDITNHTASAREIVKDGTIWTVPATIGGQNFSLRLTLATSDTWVASTLMSDDQKSSVASGNFYDPYKSPTYENTTGYRFRAGTQFSTFEGPMGADDFSIGAATVRNFTFGLARDFVRSDNFYSAPVAGYENDFVIQYADGELALGFQGDERADPPYDACTYAECLLPEGPSQFFALNLKKNDSGYVDFGQVNKSAYTGNMTNIAINNDSATYSHWIHKGLRFGMNNKVFNTTPYTDGLFNPGDPYIFMQWEMVEAYFGSVPNNVHSQTYVPGTHQMTYNYKYPCKASLPDLQVFFNTSTVLSGPSTVTIPGSVLEDDDKGNKTFCDSKICGYYGSVPVTFGAPFFLAKYAIFNYTGRSLGIADQAH